MSYWNRSPLSLVGNVKTPTLVVVGSEDYRTPVSESEQYYAALQIRGVPTALVKVPGASHGGIAARPSQSAAKAAAITAGPPIAFPAPFTNAGPRARAMVEAVSFQLKALMPVTMADHVPLVKAVAGIPSALHTTHFAYEFAS